MARLIKTAVSPNATSAETAYHNEHIIMTNNSIQPSTMFEKLLRIIYRDFILQNDTDHQNGYRQQRYSDGQDTYEIDSYEGKPRTIRRPKAVEYYSSGGKQEF